MTTTASSPFPPKPPSPRFTLELEFVLSLSNPYYLSHLAVTYPHLLNPPKETPQPPASTSASASAPTPSTEESDASKFASYLCYLYSYWRQPEYARFLTHPGATLRNLELLQQEQFRRDIIRPDVIEKLLAAGDGEVMVEGQRDTVAGSGDAGADADGEQEGSKVKNEKVEGEDGVQQKTGMDMAAG